MEEDGSPERLRPLVEQDRLFFRVVSQAGSPSPSTTPTPAPSELSVEQAFREAFVAVWGRIPGMDRESLLGHLPDRTERGGFAEPDTEEPRPLIQVVKPRRGAGARPVCDLTFPCSILAVPNERLPLVIAETLAEAYRFSTREHWSLVVDLIEEPLAQWESGEGRDATDEAHAKKLNALEKRFLRKHEAELALIRRRWGFPDA